MWHGIFFACVVLFACIFVWINTTKYTNKIYTTRKYVVTYCTLLYTVQYKYSCVLPAIIIRILPSLDITLTFHHTNFLYNSLPPATWFTTNCVKRASSSSYWISASSYTCNISSMKASSSWKTQQQDTWKYAGIGSLNTVAELNN